MKKAHPGGNQGGPEALDQSAQDLINTPLADLANRRIDRIYNLGLRRRPIRSEERSLVVSCWWRMRREGVRLPPERGVILTDGGNP